ncbi:glycoside hydrolase family 15 protein [Actinomadura barringtoniae]|uniref:Glycoside hydrolase family 15 protein n=1 Tax=Actinomadura barringtoniae TaxID=1427535 RepID=A0A939PB47_9ACTN|nr:glycoside hydrolase family 15 protein [Actinomadura barringtoniae]MBO2449517.1 glycoside hydrolase family 15 protein [Actinomadura barringtoniae]
MGVLHSGPHALREYAVVADGERAVLLGPDGDCAWMCFPSWDSPAAFDALVGGSGGYWVRPETEWRVWGGHYEERSLIWRSRWIAGDHGGVVVECREALARPASPDRAVLLRRVTAVEGPARVRVDLDVRTAFGAHTMDDLRESDGVWHARSGDVHIRWTGAGESKPEGERLTLVIDLKHGESHDLVLELAGREQTGPLNASELWAATETAWLKSVPACDDTIAPREAQLAYAVLTGLTASTGAMVAAATTSLPERAEAGRNYDYRYAWIRDQCYAGQAVAAHGGCLDLLDSAVGFISERIAADGHRLRPVYTATGARVPEERAVDLPGYPGADRVVVGNRASEQFQLDVFGEVLLLFAAAQRAGRLGGTAAQAARTAVEAIAERRNEPEAGVWETEDRQWTHSRLICVAGLRAAGDTIATAAERLEWHRLANTILAEATRTSLRPSGGWRRAPDDDRTDAALLLAGIRGALPPHDPRVTATLRSVRESLVREGFVYRYRIGDRPLGEAEGAFSLAGFLLALAERQQGRTTEALRCFERIRSACGTSGLFTEEYDVEQRQLRANLPQAFVHALLLESATRLAR